MTSFHFLRLIEKLLISFLDLHTVSRIISFAFLLNSYEQYQLIDQNIWSLKLYDKKKNEGIGNC
jgi:hypothetical protein